MERRVTRPSSSSPGAAQSPNGLQPLPLLKKSDAAISVPSVYDNRAEMHCLSALGLMRAYDNCLDKLDVVG